MPFPDLKAKLVGEVSFVLLSDSIWVGIAHACPVMDFKYCKSRSLSKPVLIASTFGKLLTCTHNYLS